MTLRHFCAVLVAALGAGGGTSAAACTLVAGESVAVASVPDGQTLRLSDGRELRLPGLQVPSDWDGARPALAALAEGRTFTLLQAEPAPPAGRSARSRSRRPAPAGSAPPRDRYNRLVAFAALAGGETTISATLSHQLLAQGAVRGSGTLPDRGCMMELLAAEAEARRAGLGLWGNPAHMIQDAADPGKVLAIWGDFAVVEGQVLSVRDSGGVVYVNFGRRYSEDFTVTVLKRNERRFSAAGLDLRQLAGRRVRIRGVVEARGGPAIEAVEPGQIEIVEHP